MARKYENSKDIAVIEMTLDEAINVGFGPICDNCNDIFMNDNEPRYYIPVLNKLFCKECLEEWLNRNTTRRYSEDNHYEKVHYNYYAEKLNLKTL
jgi:hypothetical protein